MAYRELTELSAILNYFSPPKVCVDELKALTLDDKNELGKAAIDALGGQGRRCMRCNGMGALDLGRRIEMDDGLHRMLEYCPDCKGTGYAD